MRTPHVQTNHSALDANVNMVSTEMASNVMVTKIHIKILNRLVKNLSIKDFKYVAVTMKIRSCKINWELKTMKNVVLYCKIC